MSLISNFRYRPEIDGLRAVAVVAVLLFHAGLGVPGGFIGVDVFFVISGFLITSLILKDLQTDKFTLLNFWERRARRILPAAVVMSLVTLLMGWFVLLPSDYATLGKSTAWQSVFGANLFFWRNTGYFDRAADEQPLLHTWSLAVEEQFYLLLPLALLGLFSIPAFRRRTPLLMIFSISLFASLLIAVLGMQWSPEATFYLLPSRGWELLCGSVVAILPASLLPRSRITRELLTWAALGAILLPCFLYSKATPFPGLTALPSCLGTAIFIWASGPVFASSNSSLPYAAKILASRYTVFIGLISYSLYLWHWPVFAFSRYWATAFGGLSRTFCVGAVGISFGLAILSWRFVERPFRDRRVCAQRVSMFKTALGGVAVVLVGGVIVWTASGIPSRISLQAQIYAHAAEEVGFRHELVVEDIEAGHLPVIGTPDSDAPVSLLVWGDSHAMSAIPSFDTFLKLHGLTGRAATHSSTAPVLGDDWSGGPWGLGEKSSEYNNAVLNYILEQRVSIVVLVANWVGYAQQQNEKSSFTSQVLSTVKTLTDHDVQPYVVMAVPKQLVDVPKALVLGEVLGINTTHMQRRKALWDQEWCDWPASSDRVEKVGGRVIDPCPVMLDQNENYYVFELDKTPLYRDKHHLTVAGALKVLLPLLQSKIHIVESEARLTRVAGENGLLVVDPVY